MAQGAGDGGEFSGKFRIVPVVIPATADHSERITLKKFSFPCCEEARISKGNRGLFP
jgi:hypothetical protein